ncbi:hypothetical protein [Streptomyces sp. CB00455]|nr:hypothetical protein [Streptomyces sp. CB00455]
MADEEFEHLMAEARVEVHRISFPPPSCDDDAEYAFHPQHAEFGASAH